MKTHLTTIISAVMLICGITTVLGSNDSSSEKALPGVFSVGEERYVCFSPGNLQYNAAKGTHQCADGTVQQGTWRFAEHQWDMIGMGCGQTNPTEEQYNYVGGKVTVRAKGSEICAVSLRYWRLAVRTFLHVHIANS